MTMSRIATIVVASLLVVAGCKKDDATTTTPAPSTCNSLAYGGAFVPETAGPGSIGTGAGGTIVDGTYNLTTWFIYSPGSVDPYSRKQTLKFASGTVEMLAVKDSDPEVRASGTYTVSGNDIIINFTCPAAQQITGKYTATSTLLMMYEISSGTNEVHIYTKQ